MKSKLACILIAILLIFPIPFLAGNFLAESRKVSLILITASALIWLIWRWNSSRPYTFPRASLPILAYCCYLMLLLPFSPVPYYGMERLVMGWILVTGFLILSDTLQSDCPIQTWENILITVNLVLISFDLLFALLTQIHWGEISGSFFSALPYATRLSGAFFGHANLVAGYINLVIPIILVRILSAPKTSIKIIWFLILLPNLLIHYLTTSRSAWLGLIASVIVMFFIFLSISFQTQISNKAKLKLGRTSKWLAIIGGSAILLFIPLILRQFQLGAHGTVSARLDIWQFTIGKIMSSPFFGYGPSGPSFLLSLRSNAMGVDEVFHTHNVLLEILLTGGFFGLLCFIWLAYLILKSLSAAWQNTKPGSSERFSLIAYLGAIIAVLIQGLTDFLFWQPLFAMTVLFVVALITRLAFPGEHIHIKKKHAISLMTALLTVCISGTYITAIGASNLEHGLKAAARDDLYVAQQEICLAAQKMPSATYNLFQCSLLKAKIAYDLNNQDVLESALKLHQSAIEKDPYWYVHWANQASYEWQMGLHSIGLDHMRKAAESAPQRPAFWLNLGWMEEQTGQLTQASHHYQQAICLNPWYRSSPFFKQNPLRLMALNAECPPEIDTLLKSDHTRHLYQAILAINVNEMQNAEQLLNQAIVSNPQNSVAYAYLSLVHQALKMPEQAWREAQIAQFISTENAQTFLVISRVAREQNRYTEAYQFLSRAFEIMSKPLISKSYYDYTYMLWGLQTDLSPYLVKTGLDAETVNDFNGLVQYLKENGEREQAIKISNWLNNNIYSQ